MQGAGECHAHGETGGTEDGNKGGHRESSNAGTGDHQQGFEGHRGETEDEALQCLIVVGLGEPFVDTLADEVNDFPTNPQGDQGGDEFEPVIGRELAYLLENLLNIDVHDNLVLCF